MRSRSPLSLLAVTLLLVASVPGPAVAQQAGAQWFLAGVASTLGFGAELTGRANPIVGLRGGYFLFGLDRTESVEEITYQLKPRLRNAAITVDLHPGGGIFRVSGGLLFSGTHADGVAQLNGAVDIGGTTYQPADVGRLTARGDYAKSVIPYAGLGLAARSRFTVTFDLGVAFSGYPRVRLQADSPLTGAELAALEQSVADEEAQIRDEIESHSWAKYYPVVSLGLKFRF
jgi:hypothetical protein